MSNDKFVGPKEQPHYLVLTLADASEDEGDNYSNYNAVLIIVSADDRIYSVKIPIAWLECWRQVVNSIAPFFKFTGSLTVWLTLFYTIKYSPMTKRLKSQRAEQIQIQKRNSYCLKRIKCCRVLVACRIAIIFHENGQHPMS